jgi:fumarylacetoacetate (FAA) hydrolase
MKLATYKDGSRDGQLVVVSRDLAPRIMRPASPPSCSRCWMTGTSCRPSCRICTTRLNQGKARHAFPFDPKMCMAPLPRAYQWADGSAYINHVELVRMARNAEVPANYYTEPLMYQGGSDDFIGPCDNVVCADEAYGIDFEAEVAVITGDVPCAAHPSVPWTVSA